MYFRNFDTKEVYQQLSEQLVKAQHPTWSSQQIKEVAKSQFETAARFNHQNSSFLLEGYL